MTKLQTHIGYKNLLPININSILYAYDIIIIADIENTIQKLMDVWVKEIEKIDMKINTQK